VWNFCNYLFCDFCFGWIDSFWVCKKGIWKNFENRCFRAIIRLGSAFIFLRWFKPAHVFIQVTSLHMWNKQGINRKILIGNRFHVTLRIVSPYISLCVFDLFFLCRCWCSFVLQEQRQRVRLSGSLLVVDEVRTLGFQNTRSRSFQPLHSNDMMAALDVSSSFYNRCKHL